MVSLSASQAPACSIPVFRYALEHWRPDAYTAYVFHRGNLSSDQLKLVESIQPAALEGSTPANLVVKLVDVDKELDEATTAVWEAQRTEKLPRLVVQGPGKRELSPVVFAGELSSAHVQQLMDSPLRTRIKDRLLNGDSVVWVYLECGRTDEDDAAFALLTRQLERLERELKLPEIDKEDLADLTVAAESLKIKLSAVRLSRSDPKEQVLRDVLLRTEHDLLDEPYAGQPMAFPVFGRGRVLYALIGGGLTGDLIQEACEFLTGACQCTVKAQNPGVDLLMSVDWDKFVQPTQTVDASLPPLAGFTGFGGTAEKVQTNRASSEDPEKRIDETPAEHSSADPETVSAAKLTKTDDVPPSTPAPFESSSPTSNALSRNLTFVLLFVGFVVIAATVLVKSLGSKS